MADDIIVKAGFEGGAVQRGLANLKKQADSFGTSLTAKLTGAFAGTVLIDRAFGMAAKTFEKYGDMADRAERAGISSEEFQRLGFAAELSGTSIDSAAKALKEIRKATADAAAGSESATKALERLGFTSEEIKSGNLTSIDVLLRLAATYKRAGSDAAKFSIATSILSSRTGNEMIPFLGTSDAELGKAMNREVIDNATVSQFKALADSVKAANQAMELWTANTMSFLMRAGAKMNLVFNWNKAGIGIGPMDNLKSKLADPNLDAKAKAEAKREALDLFESYAMDMRTALIGTTMDGQYMSPEVVEGIIDQKFAEFFPPDMQKARWESKKKTATDTTEAAGTSKMGPIVASSLRAIGGGGGVYSTDVMVTLAERTADAAERTADAVERLASGETEEEPVISDE